MLTIIVIIVVLVIAYGILQGLFATRPPNTRASYDGDVQRSGEKRHWLLSVVGESFKNADGSSRQAIISRCREGELIQLIRDPDNKYDSNAIKVCRANGEQIGYIGRDDAARLASELDAGKPFKVEIAFINNGESGNRAGVVLRVAIPEYTTTTEVQRL